MTIRFGNKVRLASCDRWRLWKITQHDPGEIELFEDLCDFLEWHRARVRGQSKVAAFLRWLMDANGIGYRRAPGMLIVREAIFRRGLKWGNAQLKGGNDMEKYPNMR